MQTFLPYPDFERTAAVLDRARLGKQRVEAFQILRALVLPTYGWKHHPAVKMWVGYEQALITYGVVMCHEWVGRGHPDTVERQLLEHLAGPLRSQAELADLGLAVTRYAMAWLNAFPDASVTVHHETASGQTVVQEFTFEGTHSATLTTPQGDIPPTNKRLAGRGVQALDIRDDLVGEVRLYFDQVQLLTQLGLMPGSPPG